MQLIGQVNNLKIIQRWDRIPQFVIIQGSKNTGKTHFTKYLCEMFHMNYVLVRNKINDVRELISIMREDSNTVFHFKDFEKASNRAQNTLLKITEEMPKGNCIIITGEKQINTLESRARKISMEQYSEYELGNFAKEYFSEEYIKKSYIAGVDTPTKILTFAKYEGFYNLLNFANYVYDNITCITIEKIMDIVVQFRAKLDKDELEKNNLDPCLLFFNMLINIISYNSKYILSFRYNYQCVLDILIESKELLQKDVTLNRKLLLYKTFYEIKELDGEI